MQTATRSLIALGFVPLALWMSMTMAAQPTPPTQLTVKLNPLAVGNVTYHFTTTFSAPKTTRSGTSLYVTTTVVKTVADQTASPRDNIDTASTPLPTQSVTFRDIVQTIPGNTSSFQVAADGQVFILEAGYYETVAPGVLPRTITTTFGQMFMGGQVGMTVRLGN